MKPGKSLLLTCTATFSLLLLFSSCRKNDNGTRPTTVTEVVNPPATDTSSVTAWPAAPGEIINGPLSWIFPWYSALEIPDFSKKMPPAAQYKIFIQRGNSSDWIEVPLATDNSPAGIKYEYFVEKRPDGAGMYTYGSLYVFYYGTDVKDHPSVKIVYQ